MSTNKYNLSEKHRNKLDSIIAKMDANGEDPSTIQFVISDFSSKYGQMAEPILGSQALGQGIEDVKRKEGFFPKVWEGLKVPEKLAQEGLDKSMQFGEDTGFLPTDQDVRSGKANFNDMVLKSTGEALRQKAPSFVDRASLSTMGGAKVLKYGKPLVKGAGDWIGKGFEGFSGLSNKYNKAGTLAKIFNNPSLLFGKSVEEVSKGFPTVERQGGAIRESLKELNPMKVVRRALAIIGKGETLTANEANRAKKMTYKVKNQLEGGDFAKVYNEF